ncbi:uncharacterized protein METZ01_LOCUS392904 [marine metagenome]|uniref:Uncharacterized protein n=1 Tax=marine metagenome TaxID=408172 RepID=A0A382V0R4_9ZZZZ
MRVGAFLKLMLEIILWTKWSCYAIILANLLMVRDFLLARS